MATPTPDVEPVPPLPASPKSNGRISEFASKFRFFKARRTDSASGMVDGLLQLFKRTPGTIVQILLPLLHALVEKGKKRSLGWESLICAST
jgi:hypothetical protein